MKYGPLIMEKRCLGALDILVKEGNMLGTNRKRHSHSAFGRPWHGNTELDADMGPFMSSDLSVTSTYHPKNQVSIWQRWLRVDVASCLSDGGMF